MLPNDPVIPVIDALNDLAIPYMLVGSYSSNLHGVYRGTKDADFVIELGEQSVAPLADRLMANYILDPQLGFETVTCHTRWHFHHRFTKFKLEMFLLVGDPFDQIRFQRRQRFVLCDRTMWFQSPEDLVINKVRWGRAKDIIDVKDVIDVQGSHLDWAYIEKWAEALGCAAKLAEVRAKPK